MCDPLSLGTLATVGTIASVGTGLVKGIAALASSDNPSPAPIKLNADQTTVAQNLANSFGGPNQTPVGQGLGNLGQSGLGGSNYRDRLNNLALRLNQASANPVLPQQTNQLPTTPRQ